MTGELILIKIKLVGWSMPALSGANELVYVLAPESLFQYMFNAQRSMNETKSSIA
jgi:hypothetical protein